MIEFPYPHAPSSSLVDRLLAYQAAKANVFGQKVFSQDAVDRLRDISSALFDELASVRHQDALAKIPSVISHVRDVLENVDKIVVFTHHRDVLEQLVDGLRDLKPAWIYGGMTDAARERAEQSLQKDAACRLLVGQHDAAGVGRNLTAASVAIFAELSWVPGVMNQCEDRLHRIGQKDSVLVQYLVLEGSLDARMMKTLLRKTAVIDQALDFQAEPDLDWLTEN